MLLDLESDILTCLEETMDSFLIDWSAKSFNCHIDITIYDDRGCNSLKISFGISLAI